MSSYIVSSLHLNAIVDAIMVDAAGNPAGEFSYYHDGQQRRRTAEEIGQILHDANFRSVNTRYRNSAGESGTFVRLPRRPARPAIECVKLMNCLDYQCADAADWDDSEANRILRDAIHRCVARVPGYAAAPWSI